MGAVSLETHKDTHMSKRKPRIVTPSKPVLDYRLERHRYAPELNRLQLFELNSSGLHVRQEWRTPGAQTLEEAKAKAGLPAT
jgi:hypothetical protein